MFDEQRFTKEIPKYKEYLTRVFGSRASTELFDDVIQETYIKLKLKQPEMINFCSYVRSTLFNNYLMIIGKHAQSTTRGAIRHGMLCSLDDIELPQTTNKNIEEQMEEKELYTAIAALPERQREVLSLSMEGRKFEEIAKTLNIKYDTAKANYRHGMKALQRSKLCE